MKAAYAAGSTVSGLKEGIDKAVKHMQKSVPGKCFLPIEQIIKKDPRGPAMRAVGTLLPSPAHGGT